MKIPLPNKRVRLALWWLLYRVPIDVDLAVRRDWQISCAAHIKWDTETFDAMTLVFPKHWQRMLEKRQRRLCYAQNNDGYCPFGWTPPAVGEVIRNAPLGALARRHAFGMMGVAVQYREGHHLNWQAKEKARR